MNWIEITTNIGCKNLCPYCPQDKIMKSYTSDKKIMTLDDFKMILKHINPLRTHIFFSGFSEPFLTKQSEDMMIESYLNGFVVHLYTTLEGFTDKKCKKLSDSKIIFESVNFHEYDGVGFLKEKFFKKRDMFIKNIKSIRYNTGKIEQENKRSRASNNWKIEKKIGPITCIYPDWYPYNNFRYYDNVVVPNGDVFLCCNDFSLKHKIGNIYEHHYDSVEFNKKRIEIMSMCYEYDSDVLCRSCEHTIPKK